MKSIFLKIGICLISFFGQSAWSQEVFDNYVNARSLAMGGAIISVVNDETALLANPAALGKLRDTYGTLLDPELDFSSSSQRMYNKNPYQDPFDINQAKDAANSMPTDNYYARGQIFPSFVARNFGIGIHGIKELSANMNAAQDNLTLHYRDDIALHLGFNLRFWDGRLKLGFMGKAISRIEVAKDISMPAQLSLSSQANEGVGIGFDSGFMFTAPVAGLPTFSIVARDIGSTPFDRGSGLRMTTSSRPSTLDQDYDLGISFFPIHANRTRSSISFELHQFLKSQKAKDAQRFYHAGYEWNYSDTLFIRLGMNQRYWTAGFEIASERTQFQFSSYGEEIGTDGVNQKEDRRYVCKFAFRF